MSRKLDALVAEKVMGMGPSGERWGTHPYASSIAAAWTVVERMREEGWRVDIDTWPDAWLCLIEGSVLSRFDCFEGKGPYGNGDAPLAICLAALRAKGVGEEEITEARGA